MKFSLVSVAAAVSCASTFSSAFVVRPNSMKTSFSSPVVLEASRNAQKIASRTKWAEKRGMGENVADAGETVESGLMKNDDGLEFVRLVSKSGATAEVYLFGGVVTSYKDAEGTEFIAVRPDAKMDGSKPISGGLSHCWPQVSNNKQFVLPF
jgi:glucose-6-phosphate 1-epimerase